MGDHRAATYQAIVLRTLARLAAGDARPKTLHRLRTHLRRLQAYLELVGETPNAEKMATCVSRLSRLRTLHVFEPYLTRLNAPAADLRIVRKRTRAVQAKLDRKNVYRKIERCVRRHALPPTPANPDWLAHRMVVRRKTNAEQLHELIVEAHVRPSRATLHALRLKIKSVRYQEEWALGQTYAKPDMVSWLKQAQVVLGDYEELAQFRQLAGKLELTSRAKIVTAWRRARKRARALPTHLAERLAGLERGHLRLIRSALPATSAS
jgi:CHAD domain-containing protein